MKKKLSLKKYLSENDIKLELWQKEFIKIVVSYLKENNKFYTGSGKTFTLKVLNDYLEERGND